MHWHAASARWRGRVELPRGADGRRRTRDVYGHTQREVIDRMRELTGDHPRQSLADFLCWYTATHLAGKVSDGDLAEQTRRSYRQNLARREPDGSVSGHVATSIGGRRLADLSPADLEHLKGDLAARGLAGSTRRTIWGQLTHALDTAERYGYLARNPARLVDAPRATPKRRPRWLDERQARALLATVAEDPLLPWYAATASYGLRVSEGLGLCWDDPHSGEPLIDLDAGWMTIRYQLRRVVGGWVLEPPKTAAAQRTVPLPELVVRALRRARTDTARAQLASSAWASRWDHLVVRDPDGWPVWDAYVRRHLARAGQDAGIGRLVPHDLRRSAASFLHAAGVPMAVAMQCLGWQSTQVAMRVYTRATEQSLRDAAAAMDRILG